MFTIEQGYYIAYKFLERYWYQVDKFRQYALGEFNLLTAFSCGMEPQDINNPDPLDQAKYMDWEDAVAPLGNKEKYTSNELFKALMNFLTFYRTEFEFNISEAMEDIRDNQGELWDEVVDDVVRQYLL